MKQRRRATTTTSTPRSSRAAATASSRSTRRPAATHDDINPIYSPGGRIAFVTNEMYTAMGTRADEYEHGRVVTQLATISVDGGDADRRLSSQNLSHTVAPFMRYDGKIGYSRWEHLGGVNDVKLFAANPDGTQMLAVAGQHGKPSNSLFSVREIAPNVMIGIATTRNRTIHAGALVKIDARNAGRPGLHGRRRRDQTGHACLDEENVKFDDPHAGRPDRQRPVAGRPLPRAARAARRAHPRLVGRRPGQRSVRAVGHAAGLRHLHLRPGRRRRTSSSTTIARRGSSTRSPSRRAPSRRSSAISSARTRTRRTPVRIGSVDVTQDEPQRDGQRARSSTTARRSTTPSSRRVEGPRHRGLLERGARRASRCSASRWTRAPPSSARRTSTPTAAGSRTSRRTSRCTSSRSTSSAWRSATSGSGSRACPARIAAASAATRAHRASARRASARTRPSPSSAGAADLQPIADRIELPWAIDGRVRAARQPKIVSPGHPRRRSACSCHNGGANDRSPARATRSRDDAGDRRGARRTRSRTSISRTRPITVVYDRKVETYPASYVSLFFPAAMEMGMGNAQADRRRAAEVGHRRTTRASRAHQEAEREAPPTARFAYGATRDAPRGQGRHADRRGARRRSSASIDLGGQFYVASEHRLRPLHAGDPVAPGQKY